MADIHCECGRPMPTRGAALSCAAANHELPTKMLQYAGVCFVYVESEKPGELGSEGLWTVGHYTPGGKWEPESDQTTPDLAAARCNYLNGIGRRQWTAPRIREFDAGALEEAIDALDHIARVCSRSVTQTRRLRWIQARAECAIDGSDDWREETLPKLDGGREKLLEAIDSIYPAAVFLADRSDENLGEFITKRVDAELAAKHFIGLVARCAFWIGRDYRRRHGLEP